MLKTRFLSALVLLPLVLAAFLFGPAWFVIGFIMLCMTLSIFEISGMLIPTFEKKLAHVEPSTDATHKHIFPIITVGIGWAMLLLSAGSTPTASVGVIAAGSLLALLIGCFSTRNIEQAAARACGLLISLTYGALPWIVVWHIYLMGANSRYILLVMAVTWAGDTGGYFGGRFYGGKIFGDRKLAPTISPKKTYEGAVAGLTMSVVGALLLNLGFLGELGSTKLMIIAGLVGGLSAMLGDLVESMFKRFAGVKDSGTLIPGHGGFLDRVDGILFAAPVIWAIVYYFK